MGIKSIVLVASSLFLSTSVNAALVERLGGLAYYDTEADLTWLADAGAAGIRMDWYDANNWAANLNVTGVTGWRLADTLQPDATCSTQLEGSSSGTGCTGSEMGNLFYNVLGGSAGVSITTTHNANYDLFSNIKFIYWSGTEFEFASNTDDAWRFSFKGNAGKQDGHIKVDIHDAWAVHDGDVGGASTVPIPAAAWLFGSGLLGLVGMARRKA